MPEEAWLWHKPFVTERHANARSIGNRASRALLAARAVALVAENLDDDLGRRTGRQPGNIVDVNPAATGDFVARAGFGAFRHVAEKHMVILLRTAKVEKKFCRLAREACFFLEFAKRRIRQFFSTLEDSAGQRPFRLMSRHQQNPLAPSTDDCGSFPRVRSWCISSVPLFARPVPDTGNQCTESEFCLGGVDAATKKFCVAPFRLVMAFTSVAPDTNRYPDYLGAVKRRNPGRCGSVEARLSHYCTAITTTATATALEATTGMHLTRCLLLIQTTTRYSGDYPATATPAASGKSLRDKPAWAHAQIGTGYVQVRFCSAVHTYSA